MQKNIFQIIKAITRREISFGIDLVPLHFRRLPMKKVANWVLTEGSVFFKPSRPWGFPTVLQLEPTNTCNLRCRVCPVGMGLDRPAGNMSLGMFRKLVDEIGQYLLVLMFWDWGEPLLHPDALEMIRYARRAGIQVVCSTNGHLLADRDYARKVVQSGPDVLVVSLDGITQETYQTFRTQGKLETVLTGIRNLIEEKRVSRCSSPLVNLRFIVMKHCQHEVPQLEDFARELGVDLLTLRKFHFVPGTGVGSQQKRSGNGTDPKEMIPNESRYQLPALLDHGMPVRLSRNPCKNLWNCPSIHWNGSVCSCFMDYNERNSLGSLTTDSFRSIWRGDSYARLRKAFRKSWQALELCGQCASGYHGGDIGRDANAEAIFLSKP